MDNIGITNKHYKKMSNISVAIMLVVLQAYLMLVLSGIDLFNFSMIDDVLTRYVLQIAVQLGLFSVMYSFIYFLVKLVYCSVWKKKNKSCWVQGLWLHIHIKNEIRVGTVYIKQNFNTINAEGRNITPKQGDLPISKRVTNWNYFLGKVVDDASKRDLIGCYSATDLTTSGSNDGIHTLTISTNPLSGYPNRMEGGFRDTFKVDSNKVQDAGNHGGSLYFFRISKKCYKYLTDKNGFNDDLLAGLHENDDFSNEPYVIELRRIMNKNHAQN